MLEKVLVSTNQKISSLFQNYKVRDSTVGPMAEHDLNGLIGLLIYGGTLRHTPHDIEKLYNETLFGTEYVSCFSSRRLRFLLSALRFDDSTTRESRRQLSKLAPIEEISNMFFENCRKNFIPGLYVCIDEQLFGYRGRCPFKTYLPAKPKRYGIKFQLAVCCESGYLFDGFPYIGEGTFPPGARVELETVRKLTRTISKSGRNVTHDNYYSSVEEVERLLLEDHLTVVGTFRSKPDFPSEFNEKKGRKELSSMFLYSPNLVIQSYFTKKRLVLLGSSLHTKGEIEVGPKKRSDINILYNKTKFAVDTFDQAAIATNVSRMTRKE